jgi:hypothetical protein
VCNSELEYEELEVSSWEVCGAIGILGVHLGVECERRWDGHEGIGRVGIRWALLVLFVDECLTFSQVAKTKKVAVSHYLLSQHHCRSVATV